jgi:endonuclease YncB( thermonuclease family)
VSITTTEGEVEEPEDLMVNEELLLDGTVYRYDNDDLRYGARLDAAEASATAMGLGVWGSCE